MTDYMEWLKRSVGYESLKSQYLRQYPSLNVEKSSNMDEQIDADDEEELLPSNPIERRDAKIAELEKNVADMASKENSRLDKLEIVVKALTRKVLSFESELEEIKKEEEGDGNEKVEGSKVEN